MHIEVTEPWKHNREGQLEVMACQEINGVNGSLIQPSVVKLCQVASHMKMSFKDTWSLSVWERKTKRSRKIACHWLRQVCMANADMETLPRMALWRVLQSWPTNARVAFKETEQNPSLQNWCTMDSLGNENAVRGLTRGNVMPRYQCIWWLIDPTFGFQVMSSCKSHENFV